MKKKKKEKKGIGCATIFILLPIPGAIIYGLVSEKSDLAHSFIYGCVISLVFLLFSLVSAAKEKKERRRAEKVEEFRAANAAKYGGVRNSAAAAMQSAVPSESVSGGTIANTRKKRFCTECGAELPEGTKFCDNCGTAAASAAGVIIPVAGRVNSVTVSDEPPVTRPAAKPTVTPQRSGASSSSARRSAQEVLRRIIAQLADGDISASAASGEMRLPVTEAQNEFLKLIGKGM